VNASPNRTRAWFRAGFALCCLFLVGDSVVTLWSLVRPADLPHWRGSKYFGPLAALGLVVCARRLRDTHTRTTS
jgi:hypothetical protein